VLHGAYHQDQAIRPRLADFENFVEEHTSSSQELALAER
jgi:hypothetical protein